MIEEIIEPELNEYFSLMESRPDLFRDSDLIPIIKDINTIRAFTQRTGKKIGILYRSKYNMLITDLIWPESAEPYVYERIVPVSSGSVVIVGVYENKFVLLKQFRHAFREFQYAFIRGFGEPGIDALNNVFKEVQEEVGAKVIESAYIGNIAADSGLTSGIASVYFCKVSCPVIKKGYEGIKEMILLDQKEFDCWIEAGKINDGFTLGAYSLYCSHMRSV